MHYLDTSVIVGLISNEASQFQVRAWLAKQAPGTLHISPWVVTEVSSALSLKQRIGDFSDLRRRVAQAAFSQLRSQNFVSISVADKHFATAALFAAQFETGLRGGDALHLAIAQDIGLTVATLDKRMATGGEAVGVSTLLL